MGFVNEGLVMALSAVLTTDVRRGADASGVNLGRSTEVFSEAIGVEFYYGISCSIQVFFFGRLVRYFTITGINLCRTGVQIIRGEYRHKRVTYVNRLIRAGSPVVQVLLRRVRRGIAAGGADATNGGGVRFLLPHLSGGGSVFYRSSRVFTV